VVVLLVVASEFGGVAVGWALGDGATMIVLVLIFLMMFYMRVSSSPVRVHRRYILESAWANSWVCLSRGILPWYMAVRFLRSICITQIYPSCCSGVLAETMCGMCARSIGIRCGVSWYQLRRAEWM